MKFRRTKRLVLGAALLALPLGAALASPAGAVANQLCDQSSHTECLNAYNGGILVKTYSPNVSNDNFNWQLVDGRCQSGTPYTTANCPLSGTPAGELIVQLKYYNLSNQCVGDNTNDSGDAKAGIGPGFCNSTTTGTGGAWGSLFIIDTTAGCSGDYNAFVNVHWSGSWGHPAWLGYAGNPVNGTQWYLNNASGNSSCIHQGA